MTNAVVKRFHRDCGLFRAPPVRRPGRHEERGRKRAFEEGRSGIRPDRTRGALADNHELNDEFELVHSWGERNTLETPTERLDRAHRSAHAIAAEQMAIFGSGSARVGNLFAFVPPGKLGMSRAGRQQREMSDVAAKQGDKRSILIVDDNAATRHSVRDLLEAAGYAVATAGSGMEALGHLRRQPPPSLILLDLMMP